MFEATIGYPSGTGVWAQQVRAGGGPFVVTVTSSMPSVGRLTTSASSGGSATVTILPGQSSSPGSVATGGVAFDPLTPGQTDITVTSPGAAVVGGSTWRVTVSP